MLQIHNLKKSYFDGKIQQVIFEDLNLEIEHGKFTAILGPNGCGKTTLLNILAGITHCDGGKIFFNKRDLNSVKVGYVFQDYRRSLFPWRRVKENISFPLKILGLDKKTREKECVGICQQFNINVDPEAFPYQLSGGQQQLISFIRGLIIKPDLYLLDEPFSSLDHDTTLRMMMKLSQIWDKTRITTLLVSHDIDEAIFSSNQIIVLSNKPSRVIKIFTNPLPYPRTLELFATEEYHKLKKDVLSIYSKLII